MRSALFGIIRDRVYNGELFTHASLYADLISAVKEKINNLRTLKILARRTIFHAERVDRAMAVSDGIDALTPPNIRIREWYLAAGSDPQTTRSMRIEK